MLAVEDALDGLRWADSIGGLKALIRRSQYNLSLVTKWVNQNPRITFLVEDPAIRSSTSICLTIAAPWFKALDERLQTAAAKHIVALLEEERAAYDVGSYRDAPPGLRIWGGATVEPSDIETMLPWIDWAVDSVAHQFEKA
jgi:phosphoserine aminotransferase